MIHEVVRQGRSEQIPELIEGGVSVNAFDDNGMSPLMIAIEADLPDCLAVLLQNGADPTINWPNRNHCSWSRALAQLGGAKLANLLLDNVTDPHVLVQNGCPEGEESGYLWSCLFKLNRKGAAKLAQRLLDFGLDANERFSTGLTPILIAAHKADAKTCEVIDVLLAAGADPSVSTEPNLPAQRQREVELDAMTAAGRDVSNLPRHLPHQPQTVLELARGNRKKVVDYLKSVLAVPLKQDRFEIADSTLGNLKKHALDDRFVNFAKRLSSLLSCDPKPLRGSQAVLQYTGKMSQLEASEVGSESDCLIRLEPLQTKASSAGALLVYRNEAGTLNKNVKLLLMATNDWAVAICAAKTTAPNYSLKTRDVVNRLSKIYEECAFDLLGCGKSFVSMRFKPIDKPIDLHNQLVDLCPDFDDPALDTTDRIEDAYRDGARVFLWWD